MCYHFIIADKAVVMFLSLTGLMERCFHCTWAYLRLSFKILTLTFVCLGGYGGGGNGYGGGYGNNQGGNWGGNQGGYNEGYRGGYGGGQGKLSGVPHGCCVLSQMSVCWC